MRAKITGADGKDRSVRAVRCAMAAVTKKFAKSIAANRGADGRDFLRRVRIRLLRAKNAAGRYARRAVRLNSI